MWNYNLLCYPYNTEQYSCLEQFLRLCSTDVTVRFFTMTEEKFSPNNHILLNPHLQIFQQKITVSGILLHMAILNVNSTEKDIYIVHKFFLISMNSKCGNSISKKSRYNFKYGGPWVQQFFGFARFYSASSLSNTG